MQTIKKNLPGIAVCLSIAIPSWLLGKLVPVIGGPVFSILLGMIIALLWTPGTVCKPGIGFTSKKILQAAVVLLGFGLNLNVVLQTGKQSLPIIICTITTSLLVAFVVHKLLHIDGDISTLIGVGSSICGGSAIAATAPVIHADDEKVAQAISVIFFFNVLAALLFPLLGQAVGFDTTSGEAFGIFAGTAVNDTSSVTAAASTWDSMWGLGSQTLDKAVTVKLTPHPGHHPHHPGSVADTGEEGRECKGRFSPEKCFSYVHPVVCLRIGGHHALHLLWRTCGGI